MANSRTFVSNAFGRVQSYMGKLTVDDCGLELPCRHVIVEHDINLSERAILGLWQTEPAPDVAQQVRSGIEETGFGTPVPCLVLSASEQAKGTRTIRLTCSRQHARRDRVVEDTGQIINESTNGDGLVSQLSRRRLGNNWIAHRTDCDHICKRRDDQ